MLQSISAYDVYLRKWSLTLCKHCSVIAILEMQKGNDKLNEGNLQSSNETISNSSVWISGS
jgi:hypothetical protein